MSVADHHARAPHSVSCFVLTISDTRTADNDTSGRAIRDLLLEHGHRLAGQQIVRDEPAQVRDIVLKQAGVVDVVITTGGTGITARDGTYEAIASLLDKRLDGFGELFRMLSYAEIGAAAMMSRACAGAINQTAVFSLPGSENAVRLAMSKLIVPELGHVVRELNR